MPHPDVRYVKNRELSAYMGVTVMTIWRWRHDKSLGFPQPSMINGKPYTSLAAVDAWMKSHIAGQAVTKGKKSRAKAEA